MKSHTLSPNLGFPFTPAARTATTPREPAPAPLDTDEAIRRELLSRLERQPGWDSSKSNVFVAQGTVILQGLVRGAHARQAARRTAQALPGVRAVWDARVPAREWQAMA